jgi:hypothetical protein
MRITMIAVLVLLLPTVLLAIPNVGVYFQQGQMSYSPGPYEEFAGYVYENGMDCYITAAEFRVSPPTGIMITGFEIPDGSLSLGDPLTGVSITYFPPLNGYATCNRLCTVFFYASKWCLGGGGGGAVLADVPMSVLPHPDTGRIAVACYPENNLFDLTGITSTICPLAVGTHEKSWGAIKALFE